MKRYFISEKNTNLPSLLLEDLCYPKKIIVDAMKEDEIGELIVFEAKIMRGGSYFYCTNFFEIGDKDEGGCGKFCEAYKPRNKKSGRCVHSSNCYECADNEIILKTQIRKTKK